MLHRLVINEEFDRDAAITPQIYRILKERIIKNDLPPGSRLSEPEVAQRYDISRQPVRETFIKLAEEGLVIVRPQRKTLVTKIDLPTVLQSRFIREAVEADIVALLAQAGDPALVRELRQQLANQSEVAQVSRPDFINEDQRFHRTLAEAAGKDVAWKFLERINSQMDRVRFLSLRQFPAEQLVEEHGRVVDQIELGDASTAALAMRAHLKRLIGDLPQIASEHADFFDRYDQKLIDDA